MGVLYTALQGAEVAELGYSLTRFQAQGGPFLAANGFTYTLISATDDGDKAWIKLSQDAMTGQQTDQWTATSLGSVASAFQESDTVLHVWTNRQTGSGQYLRHNTFNTSTDAWGTADTIKNNAATASNADEVCGVVRSDGDELVFYAGDSERIHGTEYDRLYWQRDEGSGYGNETLLPNQSGAQINNRAVMCTLGASDKTHVVWQADGANWYHVSVSSTNGVSSRERFNDNTARALNYGLPPVYYDDDGTERVTVCWGRSSDNKQYANEIDNDGTPGADELAMNTAVNANANRIPLSLAVYKKAVYIVGIPAHTTEKILLFSKNIDSGGWDISDTTIANLKEGPSQLTSTVQYDLGDAVARTKRAQKVTAVNGTVQHLCELNLALSKVGDPTDSLVIEIWEGGADPTAGELVGTYSVPGTGLSTTETVYTPTGLYDGIPYASSNGNTFYFVLSRSGSVDAANYYRIGGASGNPYSGGGTWIHNGSSWGTEDTSIDFYFEWQTDRTYENATAAVIEWPNGDIVLEFAVDDESEDQTLLFKYLLQPGPLFPRRQLTTVRM